MLFFTQIYWFMTVLLAGLSVYTFFLVRASSMVDEGMNALYS